MMFRSFEGNCSGDTDACSSSSTPYVSMGCVMFPVFVYVWFHYSRQYCHSQFGGEDGGSFNDSSDFEPAYYKQHSPRDGAESDPSTVLTDRLVKWINRQNVFAGFEKDYQVETQSNSKDTTFFGSWIHRTNPPAPEARTLHVMEIDTNYPLSSTTDAAEATGIGRGRASFWDEDEGNDNDTSLFWECLPDLSVGDPFEGMCLSEGPALRGEGDGASDSDTPSSESGMHSLPAAGEAENNV